MFPKTEELIVNNTCFIHLTSDTFKQISNLESDTAVEEAEPAARSGARTNCANERAKKGSEGCAQADNSAIIKDIIQAFAGAMTAQAGGQQVRLSVCLSARNACMVFFLSV